MANGGKRIQLRVDGDDRLAAGVGGAARYLADAAGLPSEASTELQSATIATCREAFTCLTDQHPHLDVTMSQESDRLEVEFCCEGTGTSIPGNRATAKAITGSESHHHPGAPHGVDKIQHETHGNSTITRLTKFFDPRDSE